MKEDKMKWIDDLSDQELVHCVRAAELADTEPSCPVDLERAAHFVGNHINRKSKSRIVAWTSASLLAFAAVLAAIFIVIRPGQSGQPESLVAKAEDPSTVVIPQEAISEMGTVPAKRNVSEEKKKNPSIVLNEGKKETNYAVANEVRIFAPIKPDKDEYRIRVVNEDKSFIFRWDASDLLSLDLILQDGKGNLIERHQFSGEDYFEFPARTGIQHHEIHWTMNVKYKDGAEGTNGGIIYFDSVKE